MAGGFMAGFGSAFSQSFSQARGASADKERDMFRLKYADYISRRDENEKTEKLAQQQIKAAKDLTARTGVPSELWGEGYKMLQSGYDIKDVEEYFTTNDFTIEPTSVSKGDPNAPAKPEDSLAVQASRSTEAQMIESGMTPPADKGIFGDLKASMGMGAQQPSGSRMDTRVTGDIAEATGQTPDTINKTLGPRPEPAYGIPDVSVKATKKAEPVDFFKANSMREAMTNLQYAEETGDPEKVRIATEILDAQIAIDAIEAQSKADAEGLSYKPELAAYRNPATGEYSYARPSPDKTGWVDEKSGQPVQPEVIYDKRQMALLEQIGKDNAKPRQEYNDKATNFIKASREIKDMTDIVKSSPEVLGAAGQVAKFGTELARNANDLINLATTKAATGELPGPGEINRIAQAEEQLKAELENFIPQNKSEEIALLASKRTLLEIKAVKFAYANAASLGQQGAGVAAKEFERFYNMAIVNDPRAWQQGMQDYIANEHATIKQIGNQINTTSTGMDQFEAQTGTPSPFHRAIDIDEQLAAEGEDLRTFIQMQQDGKVQKDPDQPNANQMNNAPAGMKAVGRTPSGKVVYEDESGKRYTE
jgi:hypothetical protein